jgi:RimJ/RimL family protein N-acetyltransferase
MSDEALEHEWPMFRLRLEHDGLLLRLVRESDLPHLAAMQPPDYEHDPRVAPLPGHDIREHRRRLLFEGYWRSLGTISPMSWCLDFAVVHDGQLIGVQSLEADNFLDVRTVDSGSWLAADVRGQGIGVAMREAVLCLAFDHLGAEAAVSSARADNGASLGVSRRLGYRDNGVSMNASSTGMVELKHMRLTASEWRASNARHVRVNGLTGCLPWLGLAEP